MHAIPGQPIYRRAREKTKCKYNQTNRDGKARRVEAGTFPLADGIPGRMGLLRGYGNAIVPEVAEVFVRAWMDCMANAEAHGRRGSDVP